MVRTRLGDDGLPVAADCEGVVAAPPAKVWAVIEDVDRFAGRVPMIAGIKQRGAEVDVDLKFRVTLFSVHFRFVARAEIEPGRRLVLVGISGEPKQIRLSLESEPSGAGTLLRTHASFDLHSLGWVVKYFLKHHPEIQCGVFPGVAIALHTFLARAALG
jgi:carbon monoxide dehydrogenase subunit G